MRTYVLPDFVPTSTNKLGYVRTGLTPPPHASPPPPLTTATGNASGSTSATPAAAAAEEDEEQLLHLCNERFTVPEVLFTPSTIGVFLLRFRSGARDQDYADVRVIVPAH